jgi:hypothetical protein
MRMKMTAQRIGRDPGEQLREQPGMDRPQVQDFQGRGYGAALRAAITLRRPRQ